VNKIRVWPDRGRENVIGADVYPFEDEGHHFEIHCYKNSWTGEWGEVSIRFIKMKGYRQGWNIDELEQYMKALQKVKSIAKSTRNEARAKNKLLKQKIREEEIAKAKKEISTSGEKNI
jgi:hypothetical protein